MDEKHEGRNTHRLSQNPKERAFAEQWQTMNNQSRVLDFMFAEEANNPNSAQLSDRDRMVAATVIQWVGSPVGQAFLKQVKANAEACTFCVDNATHRSCPDFGDVKCPMFR